MSMKIFHIGNKGTEKKGVVTIVTKIDGKDIRIGAAFCSPKDSFSRKMGVKIATGRMNLGWHNNFALTTTFSGHSANDIVRVWDGLDKPQLWKDRKLVNIPEVGLTFVEKV